MTYRSDDDFEAHLGIAHERFLTHLEAAVNEANAALGWLRAWPNKITNAEEELESIINVLRVALRRAVPVGEPGPIPGPLQEPPLVSFDEKGDVRT
jgi:hypothetical protein